MGKKEKKEDNYIDFEKLREIRVEIIKSVIIKLERQTKRARVRVSKRYES